MVRIKMTGSKGPPKYYEPVYHCYTVRPNPFTSIGEMILLSSTSLRLNILVRVAKVGSRCHGVLYGHLLPLC